MSTVTAQAIEDSLKQCMDPEVPLNIVEMGLIYGIDVAENNDVNIKMTMTTQGCPLHETLVQDATRYVKKVPGVNNVKVDIVWEPAWSMDKMSEEDWKLYHNQLFLGFCTILQNIKVNDGGYIFLISSNVIKEPNPKLIISSAYRAAFSEVFKILSKEYAGKNISCVNIAPGPINTDRTQELIENVKEFEKSLPMKRLGEPEEIGNFVKAIIENKIKYLSGVTINFDGANSNYIF